MKNSSDTESDGEWEEEDESKTCRVCWDAGIEVRIVVLAKTVMLSSTVYAP